MATQNQTAFNNLLAAGTAYTVTKLELGISATGIVVPTGNDTMKATGANLKESANPPMVVTANVRAVDWLDYGTDDYRAYEFGLYVTPAGGSEFLAVYGADPNGLGIVKAATHDTFQARIRLEWSSADLANATYTSAGNPPATTEVFGVVELATQAEVDSPASDGSDDDKVLTVGTAPQPKILSSGLDYSSADIAISFAGGLDSLSALLVSYGETGHVKGTQLVPISLLTQTYTTLYAGLTDNTTNTFRLYSVNTDTGALTQVGSNQSLGSSNWDGCGLAVLSGTLYAGLLDDTTDTFRLYSVNTDTGALTQVGSNQSLGSGNWEGCGLAVLSGTLYAGLLDDTTNTFRLYSVNTDTGALTQVGSNQSLGSSDWDGCGLAVLSGTLYAGLLDDTTNTFRLYSVNTDTGALTQVGSNQSLGSSDWEGCGLAVLSGTLYAGLTDNTTDTFRLYSVNTDTGALTQVGSNQSLGSGNWEGCGLAVLSGVGGWVANEFILSRASNTSLTLSPLREGRLHDMLGLKAS